MLCVDSAIPLAPLFWCATLDRDALIDSTAQREWTVRQSVHAHIDARRMIG
jgi:hypothetical protein